MKHGLFAVAVVLVLASGALRAHHGYTAFFTPEERTVAVAGTLESVLYANPHLVMKIRSADDTVYTVTWQAANWVERNAGVTKATFNVGDTLVVVGAPSRDPASREVTLIQEVRRPSDGWNWKNASR